MNMSCQKWVAKVETDNMPENQNNSINEKEKADSTTTKRKNQNNQNQHNIALHLIIYISTI